MTPIGWLKFVTAVLIAPYIGARLFVFVLPATNALFPLMLSVAYFSAFAPGMLIYLLMRRRRWTSFIAFLGFGIFLALFSALLPLILVTGLTIRESYAQYGQMLLGFIGMLVLCGSVSGAAFWLIVRPDKRPAPAGAIPS